MKTNYRPFVVSGCGFILIIQLAYFAMAYPAAVRGQADFSTLYTAGYMIRSGDAAQLYDYDANTQMQKRVIGLSHGPVPFNHLAYEAVVLVPLSFLPYPVAYKVVLVGNLALIVLSFCMLRSYTPHLRQIWSWLPASVFACFLPVGVALFQGQDSILLLALLICAFVAMDNSHDFRAGCFLGLTLFKFQYCVPIAILLLAWKRWRIITGFAGTAVLAVIASFAITGFSRILTYTSYLSSVSTQLSSDEQLKYAIYPLAMPNIFGLVFAVAGNHTVITMIISSLVIAWASRSRPSFPLAVAVAMLVSYHGLIHDASILIIPVLLCAETALRNGRHSMERMWVSAAVFGYPTLAVCVTLPYCLLAVPVIGFLRRTK
jgi:hypothetical protein